MRFVQVQRKAAGLDMADRIEMTCSVGGRMEEVLRKYADYIQAETLCLAMVIQEEVQGETCKINGEKVTMALRPVERLTD